MNLTCEAMFDDECHRPREDGQTVSHFCGGAAPTADTLTCLTFLLFDSHPLGPKGAWFQKKKKRLATLPCFCTVSCSRISTFASVMMAFFFCHHLDLVSSTHGLALVPLEFLYGWVSHLPYPRDAHLPVSWMQMLLRSMAEPMARLQPAVWLLPEHSALCLSLQFQWFCLLALFF